jgi:hypothetical protein
MAINDKFALIISGSDRYFACMLKNQQTHAGLRRECRYQSSLSYDVSVHVFDSNHKLLTMENLDNIQHTNISLRSYLTECGSINITLKAVKHYSQYSIFNSHFINTTKLFANCEWYKVG